MDKFILERLSEIAKLLNIINKKLELIQQSILLSLKINGKLHGLDLKISSDDIDNTFMDLDS